MQERRLPCVMAGLDGRAREHRLEGFGGAFVGATAEHGVAGERNDDEVCVGDLRGDFTSGFRRRAHVLGAAEDERGHVWQRRILERRCSAGERPPGAHAQISGTEHPIRRDSPANI